MIQPGKKKLALIGQQAGTPARWHRRMATDALQQTRTRLTSQGDDGCRRLSAAPSWYRTMWSRNLALSLFILAIRLPTSPCAQLDGRAPSTAGSCPALVSSFAPRALPCVKGPFP